MKSFSEMMDDAACCAQRNELLNNDDVRECVKLNIYDRLNERITELERAIVEARRAIDAPGHAPVILNSIGSEILGAIAIDESKYQDNSPGG